MFDEKYFTGTCYFAYRLELKKAIQDLYYKVLCYISQETCVDITDGKGKKALDMGCAFGYTTALLRKLGYDAVGLDISAYAIRRANKTSAYLDFVVADACSTPFRSGSFSLVTCFELIEHTPNPIILIKEQAMLLKEGGICVWTTPMRGFVKKVYDYLRKEKTHVHLMKQEEVEKMLKKNFKNISISSYLLLPIPPQFFNKYFLLHNTPVFMSSEMWIAAIRK